MNTLALRSAFLATLMAIASSVSLAENPKQSVPPPDQAQLKKQCENMKNMDMSKMSAAEHEAMMKKCNDLMNKDKDKPKSSY